MAATEPPESTMSLIVSNALMRLSAVRSAYGKSRSAFYDDVKSGRWTSPLKIGARAVAWPKSEVEALIAARIAGKSDAEIRELVRKLEAERRKAA